MEGEARKRERNGFGRGRKSLLRFDWSMPSEQLDPLAKPAIRLVHLLRHLSLGIHSTTHVHDERRRPQRFPRPPRACRPQGGRQARPCGESTLPPRRPRHDFSHEGSHHIQKMTALLGSPATRGNRASIDRTHGTDDIARPARPIPIHRPAS